MSTDALSRLPFIEITGTSFDAGVQLGRSAADGVKGYLVRTHAWAMVTAFRHHPSLAAAKALVETRFPRYWQELMGLAHGLDLPFDELFAWNCRGDIWTATPDGCTTVQIPGARPILAHNEDGDPGLRSHCAIALIRSEGGKAFSAFIYPGSLPGHAFAVSETGLVQTVNNIRSRSPGEGVPRMVLTRALLDCDDLDDAVRLIEGSQRWGAFHVSLAQAGDPRILSVEFTHSRCSARTVSRPSCHANHLIHEAMGTERQTVTSSSRSRQERGDEIIRNSNGHRLDPLSILWDKARPTLPIYREQPDDPDDENTLATAIFEIGPEKISWRVYGRADEPVMFRADDGQVPCPGN